MALKRKKIETFKYQHNLKNYIKILLLGFLVTIVSCQNDSTTNKEKQTTVSTENDYSSKIDSLIQTENPRKFNGVILITKKGEIKYSKAFGFADVEQKVPLSLNDNFRIQSNSKQITAVLILKEIENGRLKLDTPIKEYLPDIQQDWTDKVTIHHLLSMSSGISKTDEPLNFEPGQKFEYSNPNYILLGKIYKQVTGEYISSAANNLFKQLDMKNSFSFELDKTKKQVVKGYINKNNKLEFFDFYSDIVGFTKESWNDFIPTGGYVSNLRDLNIWDSKLHNGQILGVNSYKTMTSSEMKMEPKIFNSMKYGYGVMINDEGSFKQIGHFGSGLGSASIKFYVPEKDVNLIVIENQYIRNDRDKLYYFEKQINEIVLKSSLVN